MYTIHSASQSHTGLKRPRNEDFLAAYEPDDLNELQTSGRLYIVTDGIGGAAQGDLASQYAAEKVIREYYRSTQLHPGSRLRQAMRQVGNEIYRYAAENLGPIHMATTMVAAAIWEDSLTIANVGDSRAYLIRNGAAQQLTRDHNLASELVRDGVITEEEAQNSPVKSRITRSLGGELDVFVDVFPDIPLRPDDRLLLCSDGLTRYARLDDLVRLAVEGTLEQAVQRMIDFSNDAGGIDNTTVILIEVGESIDSNDINRADEGPESISAQPSDTSTQDTLPGIGLVGLSQQDTIKTSPPTPESGYSTYENDISVDPLLMASAASADISGLAETSRSKSAPSTEFQVVDSGANSMPPGDKPHLPSAPSIPSFRRDQVSGRRLQPYRPFGKYTPSLILVLGLIWLIGMLAVGGWFMFSRFRGESGQLKTTPSSVLPGIIPIASEQSPQLSPVFTQTMESVTETLLPTATLIVSPSLSADLTTPDIVSQGRTECQLAVQPGENLSIITTKLGIALQIDAFKCASGDNGGCSYDPQQPDALREGWVMVFPDVDRGVCEGYNGTVLETVP